jgi:hypothetical protein
LSSHTLALTVRGALAPSHLNGGFTEVAFSCQGESLVWTSQERLLIVHARLVGMEVRLIEDVNAFSDLMTSFMTEDPWSTNVIAVQLAGMREGIVPHPIGAIWIALFDGGRVAGAGMHTPPHNLFVSRLPPGAGSDIANAVLAAGHSVPGVNGESRAVADFADTWTGQTGTFSVTDVAMRMYRLEVLVPPSNVPGVARHADAEDLAVVSEWFVEFHQEAQPHAPGDMTKVAKRRLAAGQLWLWVDLVSWYRWPGPAPAQPALLGSARSTPHVSVDGAGTGQ